jgi:hypothetical protein
MRKQATNPLHMLEVVTTNGWDQMRWDRIPALVAQWHVHIIDTTDRSREQVADAALAWTRSATAGHEPTIHVPATPDPPLPEASSGSRPSRAELDRRGGCC